MGWVESNKPLAKYNARFVTSYITFDVILLEASVIFADCAFGA